MQALWGQDFVLCDVSLPSISQAQQHTINISERVAIIIEISLTAWKESCFSKNLVSIYLHFPHYHIGKFVPLDFWTEETASILVMEVCKE